MRKNWTSIGLCVIALALSLNAAAAPPNIVFILADDLGYGDLGCFGQKEIRTPNLDTLAAEGMRFTQFYSGSTVCAPSRSCLMTGQHTGHTPIRGNKEIKPEGQAPLPGAVVTLPEVLKQAGYATGAFGKWGLGFPGSEGDPTNQGFDEFFGYNCQRLAHNYYPYSLWHNKEVVDLPGNAGRNLGQYAPDLIQEKTLAFIDKHKNEPFFLFVPHVIPHAELFVPDDEIRQSYLGKFEEKPYKGVDDGPNYKRGGYGSVATPKTNFAAMVTRLDKHVGEIIAKLKECGIADNTLVMFSSDNGPHSEGGGNPELFNSNGDWRGQKRDLYEGGIRVPTIAWWPGKVAAGGQTDHQAAFWDLMPTFAEAAGTDTPGASDGISFLPTLLGEKQKNTHEYLYWEFHEHGGKQAVHKGKWKAIRLGVGKNRNAPLELYNLDDDPGETNNIAATHPEIVKEMAAIMKDAHVDSGLFNFGQSAYNAGPAK